MKQNGYMTVYLGLIAVVLTAFMFGLMRNARIIYMQKSAYDRTKVSADAMLSDYCIPLAEDYGLFAIDGGYDTKKLSLTTLEDNVSALIDMNKEMWSADGAAETFEKADISSAEMLITEDMQTLRDQILNYAKYHMTIDAAKAIFEADTVNDILDKKDGYVETLDKEEEAAEKALKEYEEEQEEGEEDGTGGEEGSAGEGGAPHWWELITDPRGTIGDLASKGILRLTLPKDFRV